VFDEFKTIPEIKFPDFTATPQEQKDPPPDVFSSEIAMTYQDHRYINGIRTIISSRRK
jgi:hypothetical protein